MADLSGRDIGRYHIVERLGEGGMATVYRAFDTSLEREVAIKVIRFISFAPELVEEMLKRFKREAKSLAKMMHANIVPIYDYGEFEGSPYLVMAYIPGGTLKKWVGKPLDYRQAARLLAPVARALAYAHRQGVIHRDVKPANILITTAGDPMLSDFGVAKILEGDSGSILTGVGVGIGTPEYMAPEQWENKVSPQSDIYALGVVLYELVTGRVPYTADTPAAVLRMQLVEPLPRPRSIVPSLPEEVERVLFKALAKKPAERYASMDELAAALESLSGTAQAARRNKPAIRSDAEVRQPTAAPAAIELQNPPDSGKPPRLKQDERKRKYLPTIKATGPEKFPRPGHGSGKARYVPTLQAVEPSQESTREASAQEAQPHQEAVAGSGKGSIPIWGYLLGGLVILGLVVGGLWALAPKGNPQRTPMPAASSTLAPGVTRVAAKDGMVLVYIPAGSFLMGSDKSKDSEADPGEMPQHTVYLDAFWIDRTDITNAMYAQCVQAGSCQPPVKNSSYTRSSYYDNATFAGYPVIYVAWKDANNYCAWAGRRLPSEAQWEKAARGTDGRIYPWGDTADSTKANYVGKDTTAAGSYPSGASPYGVLDMAGNVWQWVADRYSDTYYQSSPSQNPGGPATGDLRVLRGGAWVSVSRDLHSAYRIEYNPGSGGFDIGFRCASSP